MDYEELIDNLKEKFDQYCEDNKINANDTQCEQFTDMAVKRIEELMSGGLDMSEAYEWYGDEINDDLSFILDWESDGEKE